MVTEPKEQLVLAFAGRELVASGELPRVAAAIEAMREAGDNRNVLFFDHTTGRQVDLAVLPQDASSAAPADKPKNRVPGRPKLGVVGREVTLLPRHWEWLNAQPGGASVALRKLVEQARKANAGQDRVRRAQEAAYRFMSAMAGNERGFEEAARALFASDASAFEEHSRTWPADVRRHSRRLAEDAFSNAT